jgi:effector-binding domain-containing protein
VRYAVHADYAEARPVAAIRAVSSRARLGLDIVRLLDEVWPVVRDQDGVRAGQNVVVYHGASAGMLTIDVGVEVDGSFVPHGEVRLTATPAGEVARTAHFGEYSDLAGAYNALAEWCAASARRPAGVNWEVYGDWEEEPAKRRTDVFSLLEPAAD